LKIRSATKKEGAKSQVKTKFNDEGGRGGAGGGGGRAEQGDRWIVRRFPSEE